MQQLYLEPGALNVKLRTPGNLLGDVNDTNKRKLARAYSLAR